MSAMNKKFNWMPILKTGTFTARSGRQVEFDEEKLDQIIANTDLGKEPQFVIEHPRYDKLGFGTIEKLKRVGKYLLALPKTVDDKFKEIVNRGELPGRSVCLDETSLALSSIGFLPPSVKPAVDGLGSYEFAGNNGGNENTIEFSFEDAELVCLEEEDTQTEPPENSGEQAEALNNETGNAARQANIDLSSVDTSRLDLKLKLALESLIDENKKLTANLETAKTELESSARVISESRIAQDRKEVLEFCKSEEMKFKILPSEVEKISALLLVLKEKGTLEFSSSEDSASAIRVDAFNYLKDILKQLPDKIEFGELATYQNAGDTGAADYRKAGSEIASFVNKTYNNREFNRISKSNSEA